MNTKGLIILAVAVLAFVFAPSVPVAQGFGQSLVSLPDDAVQLIGALVTAGIAWLLLKIDMGQYTQALAAAIAPIVVALLERLTGMIPAVYDNVVLSVIHLIVLFVSGSVGAFLLIKRIRQPNQLLQ